MSRAPDPSTAPQRVVLITGPSGAGRSTAINVLEDIGYEVIDNLPLSLMPRLIEGPAHDRPLALGIDVRNRDFSVDTLWAVLDALRAHPRTEPQLLFLDCSEEVLVRRYAETRRRHPLAPDEAPVDGIRRESGLLVPVRRRADILIDTSALSPNDLRTELAGWFAPDGTGHMGVTLQSFSYKRGLPVGLDMCFDCRFLRNPHWEAALRPLTGLDPAVARYVAGDQRFDAFALQLAGLFDLLLPGFRAAGKAHLSVGFGCTGGQHRSVAVTEWLAAGLAERGWQVSIRHRELERRSAAEAARGQERDA
ncbi:MAG: ATP-binding protein ManX [Rhodobacteraceae bacterium HLUCCA08]|nr:MAG: ATP-binding protein ManX [Rhodobacteraceae bacterium HLUCCA08]